MKFLENPLAINNNDFPEFSVGQRPFGELMLLLPVRVPRGRFGNYGYAIYDTMFASMPILKRVQENDSVSYFIAIELYKKIF